ncbi:hypothetical protein PF005_g23398 [Phytophthora fragariae]|uniref:Uncharacterized protein n=1 Tax=Phytophthora fragariae TaxID=53985 RepID=A0A6A3WHS6_9STRA|nr:hypothetical protein PF009_g2202 [Phytophthora fragariae]KAE8982440.1 hypothetical protein PF011_g21613 [Phytophthora fragariae]KAE9086042.1 hypothetical protein PF010_g20238 [Phytophthora fragariae]KAE9114637.1 hypothetical protein PF006_g19471 [Phytophthora fragariae]KAE9137376.1 hypothetical protein PF007_g1810 [Phytophthora fragariae]
MLYEGYTQPGRSFNFNPAHSAEVITVRKQTQSAETTQSVGLTVVAFDKRSRGPGQVLIAVGHHGLRSAQQRQVLLRLPVAREALNPAFRLG